VEDGIGVRRGCRWWRRSRRIVRATTRAWTFPLLFVTAFGPRVRRLVRVLRRTFFLSHGEELLLILFFRNGSTRLNAKRSKDRFQPNKRYWGTRMYVIS
jgi:hypothetical protein